MWRENKEKSVGDVGEMSGEDEWVVSKEIRVRERDGRGQKGGAC